MRRRDQLTGICGGCSELWPHRDRMPYPAYWATEGLDDPDRDGKIIAVARALECTREEAIRRVGRAAAHEGKSFDESLLNYFWLYTNRITPRVEGYGGRVAVRGQAPPLPVESPPAPIQTGRIQSRKG